MKEFKISLLITLTVKMIPTVAKTYHIVQLTALNYEMEFIKHFADTQLNPIER